jgi:chitinase
VSVGLAATAILLAACAAHTSPEEDPGSLDQDLSSCSVKINANTYSGPDYWGTLTFTSASALTAPSISFTVPSGVTCTHDYDPTGFSHTQSGNVCTFTGSSTVKVAAGKAYTINYSTDSGSSFTAKNVGVRSNSCGGSSSSSSSGGTTSSSSSSSSSGGTGGGAIQFAPYFETWNWGDSSYPFTGLVDLKNKSGVNGVTLAFVLSNGGCAPTTDIQAHQSDVNAFVASGGLVKASFGGADGTYLDAACSSASAFAGALESFVKATGIKDLDFDVEQSAVMTTAANQKRAQGLKQAQDALGIQVSFTLPVDTTGLESNGLDVVKQAHNAGVAISHVNLMVMDYDSSLTGDMATYAEQALTATQAQLVSTLGLSSTAAWAMLGATPMIGKNDVSGEVFTLADAKTLLTFAQQKHLGLLSFWSIHRDRTGTNYNDASTVNTASYQFANVFKAVQ